MIGNNPNATPNKAKVSILEAHSEANQNINNLKFVYKLNGNEEDSKKWLKTDRVLKNTHPEGLTGKDYSTYGSQLLSQMTGISPEIAEAVYGLPLMWNGGNALRTGSNVISHSASGLKNSEILTKGINGARSTLNSVSKWAAAHPNATEAIVGGTVSTGFDIYNGNATPEGTAMNYIYSRALAGRNLSTQLSLGTIYQGVISANNASKTDQEIVSDILKKDAGTIVAYKAVSIGNAGGKAKLPILLGSSLLGGAIENTDLYKENKDKK